MPAPIAIFAGPSLRPADRPDDGELLWLPPVARGDVARLVAARRRPRAIAIIDGHFEGRPAVLHKEILWALAEGIPVWGAASMGALRAAELQAFGMVGVGRIFEWFRDGLLTDDDEVAVRHGPAALGWPPVSLPMVDLRATVDAALRAQILDAPTAAALIRAGKGIFYKERDWQAVLRAARHAGGDLDRLAAFAARLPAVKVSQKRLDALALLDLLRNAAASTDPPRAPFDFGWTTIFAALAGPPGRPHPQPVDADPLLQLVLDEVRLDPVRFAWLAPRARAALATISAPTTAMSDPLAALAGRLGLIRRRELEAWAKTQGLQPADLGPLAVHAARLEAAELQVDDAFLEALLQATQLSGLYPAAAARAQRKLRLAQARTAAGGGDAAALRLWYFETLLAVDLPDDLEREARRRGFRDLDDFTRALRIEWLYRSSQ